MRSNTLRSKLAYSLRKRSKAKKENIWKDVARNVLAARRNRPVVNIGEISRNSKDGSIVLIAGKVLGAGKLDHKVTVAAYSFSEEAKEKVVSSGGKCLSLGELMESSTSAKGVIVLG